MTQETYNELLAQCINGYTYQVLKELSVVETDEFTNKLMLDDKTDKDTRLAIMFKAVKVLNG